MKLKLFMTTDPLTIHPDTGIKTAFRLMKKGNFRQLPVIEDGKLIGIITDRDIRRPDFADDIENWEQVYRLDDRFKVRGIMTEDVTTVNEDDELESACRLLNNNKFNALPVCSNKGNLVGILTLHDLIEPLIQFLKDQKSA